MKLKQILALIGSVILGLGVLAPVESFGYFDSVSLLQRSYGHGVMLAFLAGISAAIAIARKYEYLWLTGVLSLGLVIYAFIDAQSELSGAKAALAYELAKDPSFKGPGVAMMQAAQLGWGIYLLFLGVALLFAAAAFKDSSQVGKGPIYDRRLNRGKSPGDTR